MPRSKPVPKADLRQHVAALLRGGSAHATLEHALNGLTAEPAGKKVPRLPYTCWEQMEHIRIAQQDILEFTRDPGWNSPAWPKGYWPATPAPPSAAAFRRSRAALAVDLEAMAGLVLGEDRDLLAPLAHAPDKSLLREALLLADHNAYHLGQLILARRLIGAWKD